MKLTIQPENKIRVGKTECALEGSVEDDSSWEEGSPSIQAGASPLMHKARAYPHLVFSGKPGHFRPPTYFSTPIFSEMLSITFLGQKL